MSKVRITVELIDADFRKAYDVDIDQPLVALVQVVAKEENVPLRTRQGRPLAWTAEGPEWRGDKGGITDLVRTQPLRPIVDYMREQHGDRSPLFEVRVNIPGAREAIHGAREVAKVASIEANLKAREAERDAELGAHMASLPESTGLVMELADEEPPPPPPPPVENRIRRAAPAPAGIPDVPAPPPKKKKKKAAAAKGAASGAAGLPTWAIPAAAGGALLVMGLLLVVVVGGKKTEPPPAPTPEPVVEDAPIDIPMKAPEKKVEVKAEATPPPIPFKTFYSKGTVTRTSQKATGAQISSFAKPDVRLNYTVVQSGPGKHSVTLKNRFTVEISDTGGAVKTASTRAIKKGAAVGEETKVQIHYDGAKVRVRVGGRSYGPYAQKSSSGFPGWQFELDPSVEIKSLRAATQSDSD